MIDCLTGDYFNSQPHKEADETLPMYMKGVIDFNSQPHKEADELA